GTASKLGIGYPLAERLLIFFPFAFLPFVTMFLLLKRFTGDALARFVGAFLYGANSYILLIGSNQMLIALAYGLAPLAFACLLDAVDNSTDRLRSRVPTAVTCGLWLALVATLDTRVAYMTSAVLLFFSVVA